MTVCNHRELPKRAPLTSILENLQELHGNDIKLKMEANNPWYETEQGYDKAVHKLTIYQHEFQYGMHSYQHRLNQVWDAF